MTGKLYAQIEDALGKRPQRHQALHGGMIGEVYAVDLAGGQRIVAKVSRDSHAILGIEAYMLRYLRENSRFPVPEVLFNTDTLLLMTFIEGSSQLNSSVQRHAADLLADLHNVSAADFGLDRATVIGILPQPNPWTASWIDFFRDHRLLHMAKLAHQDGPLPPAMFARIEKLAGQLERWLLEPDQPSLIHGDMWTTNVLAHNGQVTGFVDPATYFGHAEIELAYSTLFGTFGEAFFQRYHERRPIAPGFFEERRDLYNLYPLLVHVRLFGGGYVGSVDRVLRRYGV